MWVVDGGKLTLGHLMPLMVLGGVEINIINNAEGVG